MEGEATVLTVAIVMVVAFVAAAVIMAVHGDAVCRCADGI
jgi:hypothetical protein